MLYPIDTWSERMSSRELVVLGSASQVPTRYRNHNGYLLLWDDHGLLFDPGEGTQRQMTIAGVAVSRISRVLITHFHGDHCLGLPGILQRISLDQVPHPVKVHYPKVQETYFERLRYASVYVEQGHIVPHPVERPGLVDEEPTLKIFSHRLDHTIESWGWRIEEPDGFWLDPERLKAHQIEGEDVGRILKEGKLTRGERVIQLEDVGEHKPGQSMAFIMDTRMCDGVHELARGVDLLVCEATFLSSEAELAEEYGHLTASQAGQIARDAGARRLVLTHFSQRYTDEQGHLDEAQVHHSDVVAAKDFMRVAVPSRGVRPAARS
jgi:ribonuclease Z